MLAVISRPRLDTAAPYPTAGEGRVDRRYSLAVDFVEPPETSVLIERARNVVRNMPGCFTLKGEAHDEYDAGVFGKGTRHWLLEGRLSEGVWTTYTATLAPDSPDKPDKDEKRPSIFGRSATEADGADEGRKSILDALQDDVTMEYLERNGEGWTLIRTLKGGTAARNVLRLGFNSAFEPHDFAIQIVDPVVVAGDRGRAKIAWMDLALKTDERGAPESERFEAIFKKWPFSVEIHSNTVWTAEPCT